MLKFISNKKGIMGLTLSQIGLFIATGILITAVFSFIYLSDFNRKEEIDNIGNSFTNYVSAMDSKFFENKTNFLFKDYDFDYSVFISTQYISVETDGNWNNVLSSKNAFLKKPLIRDLDPAWKSSQGMHSYLKNNFGYYGNKSKPIEQDKIDDVKSYFELEMLNTEYNYAKKPFEIDLKKPVLVEKVYIYYDTDDNNIWEKEFDEKDDFILIYQK